MRYAKYSNAQSRYQNRRAAIFVDFENLYALLSQQLDGQPYPDAVITEVIDELRRYLLEELRTPTHLTEAFADFSTLSGNGTFIQRALVLQDVEPRFTASAVQPNASEIRLCTEALSVMHLRDDITTFAVVAGDRTYLPLLQHLKRQGRTVLLVTLEAPEPEALSYLGEEAFVDLCNLLSEPTRQQLLGEKAALKTRNGVAVRESREDVEYLAIEDPAARRTLEIIEEHFGQYEEVYLTPLLRKLSELLGDEEHDPKTIINDLEDAGAVWLEKRRGFPYDYTVLLVDTDHPDVQQIQQDFYDRQEQLVEEYPEDYQDTYEYDEYDEYPEEEEEPYDALEEPETEDAERD